jgi:hypothetical protein
VIIAFEGSTPPYQRLNSYKTNFSNQSNIPFIK